MADTAEIIASPKKLLAAAQDYTEEALEVIANIMRKSDSEKMKLMAALALLDRAGVIPPRKPLAPPPPETSPETKGDMRNRIVIHMRNNIDETFDENGIKFALGLKSPPQAIRATMMQLKNEGVLKIILPGGKFQAV